MGWAGGSELMAGIIRSTNRHFGKVVVGDGEIFDQRMLFYDDLIRLFENHDCDTLDECLGRDQAFDSAIHSNS